MAYRISSPRNSFLQFGGSSVIESCQFQDFSLCLPVYETDDQWFQFIVTADTEEEAAALCDLENSLVTLSLVDGCSGDTLLTFSEKPDRYRIGGREILYNWQHGLPGFEVVPVGNCFNIRVVVDGANESCSNCLQRISNPCHTSVLEYGNDENAFGFNYCNSEGEDASDPCEPLFIQFTEQSTLTIPYTASLQAQYGTIPTVKVWIYDESGELVNMSVRQAFDTYPPTELRFDFGGPATGVIKIN